MLNLHLSCSSKICLTVLKSNAPTFKYVITALRLFSVIIEDMIIKHVLCKLMLQLLNTSDKTVSCTGFHQVLQLTKTYTKAALAIKLAIERVFSFFKNVLELQKDTCRVKRLW